MVQIEQLINPTDAEIDYITTAWHIEWHEKEDHWSYEETRAYTKYMCQENKLPIMVVAKDNNTIVGAVAIATSDLHTRPDLYPDVINLYIWPEYRNQGIGKKLLNEACKLAFEKSNYNRIFLYTELDSLYEKFGWTFVGKIDTVYLEPRYQNLYYLERNK